jgi:hypothetical protein
MVRHTAVVVVMALVASSGALLMCQWTCASNEAARGASVACHKTQDDAAVLQASGHDCIATTAAQETTAAKSVERTKPPVSTSPARTLVGFAILPFAPTHNPAPPGTHHLARSLSVTILRV